MNSTGARNSSRAASMVHWHLLSLIAVLATTSACSKPQKAKETEASQVVPPHTRPPDKHPEIPEGTPSHLLKITLSNQSAFPSTIDFQVFIDNQQIWSGDAEVQSGHNILSHEVRLTQGNHVITVKSRLGKAVAKQDFRLDGTLYIDIAFWHHPERTNEMHPRFKLNQSLTPFSFG